MASAEPLLGDVEGGEDHVVSVLDNEKFKGLLKGLSLSQENQHALRALAGGAAGSDEKASPMTIIALEWPDFLIIPAKALMFALSLYLLPHNEHGAIMAIFPLAGLCLSAYITMDLVKQLKQNEMTTDQVIQIFQESRDSMAKTALSVMMMITAVGLSTFFKMKVSGIVAGCVQLLDTVQSSKAASSLKAERRERKNLQKKSKEAEVLKAQLKEDNMKLENDCRLAQERVSNLDKELQYLKNSKSKDSVKIAEIAAKEAELQRLKNDSDNTQREAAKAREELKWLNEHSAKLEAKLEAESKSKDAKPQQAYLVENRKLEATTEGLTARKSKDMNDRDEGNIADWNTIVYGVDAGGGWVKVNDVFLPKKIEGATVLKLQQERDLQVRQQVLAEELALQKQNEAAEQLRRQEEQAAKKQNEMAEQLRKQAEQAAKKQNDAAQQLRRQEEQAAKKQNEAAEHLRRQEEQAAKKQNEMAEQLRRQEDKVAELQELERQHQLNNLALADRIDGLQRQSAEQDQRVAQMGEQLGHLSPRLDKLSQDHEESVVALDTEAQRLEGMLHGPAPSVEADMQKISKEMEAFKGQLHGLSQAQTQDQHNVHEVDMLQKEFCQRVNDEMALLTGKVDGVTDTVNQLQEAERRRAVEEANRKAEAERKDRQKKAAALVRQIVQKVRDTTVESSEPGIQHLRVEFSEELIKQAEELGNEERLKLQEEASNAFAEWEGAHHAWLEEAWRGFNS